MRNCIVDERKNYCLIMYVLIFGVVMYSFNDMYTNMLLRLKNVTKVTIPFFFISNQNDEIENLCQIVSMQDTYTKKRK